MRNNVTAQLRERGRVTGAHREAASFGKAHRDLIMRRQIRQVRLERSDDENARIDELVADARRRMGR